MAQSAGNVFANKGSRSNDGSLFANPEKGRVGRRNKANELHRSGILLEGEAAVKGGLETASVTSPRKCEGAKEQYAGEDAACNREANLNLYNALVS